MTQKRERGHDDDKKDDDDDDEHEKLTAPAKKMKMSHTNNMDDEGETTTIEQNNDNMMEVNDGEVSGNNTDDVAAAGDKTKIFMQGLPYTATKEDVAHFFRNCGTIKHIDLPLDYDGRSSGSALVSFETTDAAAAAVALHGEMFDEENERWVRIKYDTPRVPPNKEYQKQQHHQTPVEKPDGCLEVYIGNLSWHVDEQTIRDTFQECGAIETIRFAEDRTTGDFKGFGHIKFQETESTDKAVALSGIDVLGKTMKVQYALGKPDVPKQEEQTYKSSEVSHGGKKGKKEVYSPKPNKENMTEEQQKLLDGYTFTKVYMHGLPFNATEDDVRTFLQHCGDIKNIKFVLQEDGRSTGRMIVEFQKIGGAKSALLLNNEVFDSTERYVVVRQWTDNPVHRGKNGQENQQQRGSIKKPEGCREVHIRNLSSDVDEKIIRATFEKKCGTIDHVSFIKDKETKKFAGYGYIRFKKTESTDKAVKMTGVQILGKSARINYALASSEKGDNDVKQKPLSKKPEGCKDVYIGGLSSSITQEDVRDLFKDCGEIEEVVLSMDNETVRCKGFGHIRFKETESTDKAVEIRGTFFMGRFIKVDYSASKKKKGKNSSPAKGGGKSKSKTDKGAEAEQRKKRKKNKKVKEETNDAK